MGRSTDLETPFWHNIRRTELDWLRVLAFGLLIFYHVGMLYVSGWDWHFKSTYQSQFLANVMMWSSQWRMSMLFFISGVTVSYLLHKQQYWQFFRSRHTKILLPLIFGMCVVVAPQVYVEMVSKGLIGHMNYWSFWLAYLDQTNPIFDQAKTVGRAHITWNHLWFLPYIFSYSLILWLFYPLLNSPKLIRTWQTISLLTPSWMILIAPIVVYFLIGELLWKRFPTTHAFWNDWFNHGKSFFSFLLGFGLVRSNRLWTCIRSFRWLALTTAMATYAYTLFAFNGGKIGEGRYWQLFNGLIWSANGWLWMLAIIAWAQHKLTFTNAWLRYLNGGVYCFYIMHQTVIIVIAYYLVPLKLSPVLESFLVIACTVLSCWLVYEITRRVPILSTFMGANRTATYTKRSCIHGDAAAQTNLADR